MISERPGGRCRVFSRCFLPAWARVPLGGGGWSRCCCSALSSPQRISFLRLPLLQRDVQVNAGQGGRAETNQRLLVYFLLFLYSPDAQVPVCSLQWDRAGVCCLGEFVFHFGILWPHEQQQQQVLNTFALSGLDESPDNVFSQKERRGDNLLNIQVFI